MIRRKRLRPRSRPGYDPLLTRGGFSMRKGVVLALLVSCCALTPARAEIELPQPSPGGPVKTAVGTTDVTIDYHRPGVKGRKIWGELVPYGQVWRLGANQATTI